VHLVEADRLLEERDNEGEAGNHSVPETQPEAGDTAALAGGVDSRVGPAGTTIHHEQSEDQ